MLTVINTTKSAAAKKASATVTPIDAAILLELASYNLNKCNQIKSLYASGFSRAQIILAGYNATTVHRQVLEYIQAVADKAAKDFMSTIQQVLTAA